MTVSQSLSYPKFQLFDANGDPLSGGYVYSYFPGTSTAKTTYSDHLLTTANANPIVLDSNGEAAIWVGSPVKLRWGPAGWDGTGSPLGEMDWIGPATTLNAVYPEWWGAKADGVTDCTTAFTSALAEAKSSKVPLLLGAGTYLLDSATIDSVQVSGTGITGTILKARSVITNFIVVTGGGGGASVEPMLSNLKVDGNNKADYGVVCNAMQQGRISDLLIQQAVKDGLYLEASYALGGNYYNWFTNIKCGASITGNGRNGFRIISTDGPEPVHGGLRNNSNTFVNCTAHSNTAEGWYIDYAAGNTFVGCNAEGNKKPGFSIIYGYSNSFYGGYSEHNADHNADTSTTYRKLTVGSVSGDYTQGEGVTQATSGATGTVLGWQANLGLLWLSATTGTFDTTNTVTGDDSGATSTPSAVAYADISFYAELTGARVGGGSNGVTGTNISGGRHIGLPVGDWFRAGNQLFSWSDSNTSPIYDDQGNAYLYKLTAKSYKTLGSNGAAGTLTLTAGTSTTVNNTSVTANSLIFPVPTNAGAAAIVPYQTAVSAGASFTLTHAAAAGTETYNYFIIN